MIVQLILFEYVQYWILGEVKTLLILIVFFGKIFENIVL